MRTSARRRWREFSSQTRTGMMLAGVVQVGLLGAAMTDRGRREAGTLNGPRWVWAPVSPVNFVGPILYFAVGRRGRSGGVGAHGPDSARRWAASLRT